MDFTPAQRKWEALPPEKRLAALKDFLENRIENARSHAAAYENPKDSGEQYCHYHFSGELNAYREILAFFKLGQPGGQK